MNAKSLIVRAWLLTNLALLAVVGITNADQKPTATALLPELEKRAADTQSDKAKLWDELVEFCRMHYGTPEALRAAQIRARIPSPLDHLDETKITNRNFIPWLQKEAVAVLGDSVGRQWDAVECLMYSPKGTWIVSCGQGLIYFWNPKSLAEEFVLNSSGAGQIESACISPDEKWLVTSGHKVRLWNLSAKKAGEIVLHEGFSHAASFSRDGQVILARCEQSVKAWAANNGDPKVLWNVPAKGGTERTNRVFLSPLGNRLLVAVQSRRFYMWDLAVTPPKIVYTIPPSDVEDRNEDKFFADGGEVRQALVTTRKMDTLITKTWDKIEFWTLRGTAAELSRTIKIPRTETVYYHSVAALSKDGALLAVSLGSRDLLFVGLNEVGRKRLGLREGEESKVVPLPVFIQGLAFSADGRELALGGRDGVIRVWNIVDGKIVEHSPPRHHVGPLQFANWSPDGRSIFTGGAEQKLIWWDMSGAKPSIRSQLQFPADPTLRESVELPRNGQMFWLPDGKTAMTNMVEKRPLQLSPTGYRSRPKVRDYFKLSFADRVTATPARMPNDFSLDYPPLAVSPNGKYALAIETVIVSAVRCKVMTLLEYSDGRHVVRDKVRLLPSKITRREEAEEGMGDLGPRKVAFSIDDQRIALSERLAQRGDRVRIFRIRSGKLQEENGIGPLRELDDRSNSGINDIAFSPDLKTLAVAYGSACVRLWDISGKQPVHLRRLRYPTHDPSMAWSLAFSPDARFLAWFQEEFVLEDKLVLVYDLRGNTFLHKWDVRGRTWILRFGPDSRHLLIGQPNGAVEVVRLSG